MNTLKNPPIIEAQVGLKLQTELSLDILKQVAEKLKSDLPDIKPRFEITTEVKLDGDVKNQSSTNINEHGIQLNSANNDFALILQKDIFIFCALNKYEGWDSFKRKVSSVLTILSKELPETQFVEIFSRYINSIVFEAQPLTLSEFFTFIPKIPTLNPQLTLNGFALNFNATQANTGFQTFCNFAPRPQPAGVDKVDFILDLSVSKRVIPVGASDSLWDDLNKARIIKNDLFFGLITDKLKARYN